MNPSSSLEDLSDAGNCKSNRDIAHKTEKIKEKLKNTENILSLAKQGAFFQGGRLFSHALEYFSIIKNLLKCLS